MDKKIIVAIDGHSSCGKSTMAKTLARRIKYIYIDTGAMYRGVALFGLRGGFITEEGIDAPALVNALDRLDMSFRINPETGTPELYLGQENVEQEIRGMQVASWVSQVAALPEVRAYLTTKQQEMGQERGIVMDGRDIGTNVFPDAELKVFVTADPKVRAQRRLLELRGKGDEKTSLEEVLHNLEERDRLDSTRAVAPLRQAEDAKVLDNSHMTREEQDEKLFEMFEVALKTQS